MPTLWVKFEASILPEAPQNIFRDEQVGLIHVAVLLHILHMGCATQVWSDGVNIVTGPLRRERCQDEFREWVRHGSNYSRERPLPLPARPLFTWLL